MERALSCIRLAAGPDVVTRLPSGRLARSRLVEAAPPIRADLTRDDLTGVRLQEMGASVALTTPIWRVLVPRHALGRRARGPLAIRACRAGSEASRTGDRRAGYRNLEKNPARYRLARAIKRAAAVFSTTISCHDLLLMDAKSTDAIRSASNRLQVPDQVALFLIGNNLMEFEPAAPEVLAAERIEAECLATSFKYSSACSAVAASNSLPVVDPPAPS